MEQPLIAIVDDDESVRDATERLMRSVGIACLVTDLNMPGMSGFDLHRRLQLLGRSIPTVLITGQPNENVRTQALSLGIICYLPKPFRDDDLIAASTLRFARGRHQARRFRVRQNLIRSLRIAMPIPMLLTVGSTIVEAAFSSGPARYSATIGACAAVAVLAVTLTLP
jgi:FixJ family two-component response regulator